MQVPMFTVGSPAVKDIAATWQAFMGLPQGEQDIPRSLRDFGRQPADEAWVYRCMSLRAVAAQGVPLKVEIFDPTAEDHGGWVPADGRNDPAADALQFLLDDVNPAWHGPLLQAYMEAGAVVHGGSYLAKVRGRLGGYPQELHWLSGADVEPLGLESSALPTGYRYQPQGRTITDYEPRDVIPLRDSVNLENPYKLLSPLSSARYSISVNKQAAEWNSSVLRNWGIPPIAWIAPKDVDFAPAELSTIRRVLRGLRGPQNAGKAPVLPGGLEPRPLSLTQKDADWLGSQKLSRMGVCAVTGVPLPLAGDDDKNSVYAVIRDAERVMWRMTMIPSLDGRAATLNSWLVPEFDPTRKRLRVGYDYSGIEALQPAPAEAMAQWNEAVKIGVPLNRFISRFGMGQPVKGGDESRILLRTGEIPLADATNEASLGGPAAPASTPRPESYNTAAQAGNEAAARAVAALGKGLYRHAAVREFIATGRTADLAAIVPPDAVPVLATGLHRRESAEQIAARLTEVNA